MMVVVVSDGGCGEWWWWLIKTWSFVGVLKFSFMSLVLSSGPVAVVAVLKMLVSLLHVVSGCCILLHVVV